MGGWDLWLAGLMVGRTLIGRAVGEKESVG